MPDFTWRKISHRAVLDLIAALGFEGVDIGLVPTYSTMDPWIVREKPAYWAGFLAERARSRGLELTDIFPIASMDLCSLAPNHPNADERNQAGTFFREMLVVAEASGAGGMTIVPGTMFDEPWTDALERAAEALKWRLDEAAACDVPLSVECHIESVANTPEKVMALLDAVPGLQLTLDTGTLSSKAFSRRR